MQKLPVNGYPIWTTDIYVGEPGIERNLHGAFGNESHGDDFRRNRAAFMVVSLLQSTGSGFERGFRRSDFADFCRELSWSAQGDADSLELLIEDGVLVELDGLVFVTHEFVTRCFLAAPSPSSVREVEPAAPHS